MDHNPSPPCWLPATPLHVTPASLLLSGQREGSASLQQPQPVFALLSLYPLLPQLEGGRKKTSGLASPLLTTEPVERWRTKGKGPARASRLGRCPAPYNQPSLRQGHFPLRLLKWLLLLSLPERYTSEE